MFKNSVRFMVLCIIFTFYVSYATVKLQNEHNDSKRHDCTNYYISKFDIFNYLDITMTSPLNLVLDSLKLRNYGATSRDLQEKRKSRSS